MIIKLWMKTYSNFSCETVEIVGFSYLLNIQYCRLTEWPNNGAKYITDYTDRQRHSNEWIQWSYEMSEPFFGKSTTGQDYSEVVHM